MGQSITGTSPAMTGSVVKVLPSSTATNFIGTTRILLINQASFANQPYSDYEIDVYAYEQTTGYGWLAVRSGLSCFNRTTISTNLNSLIDWFNNNNFAYCSGGSGNTVNYSNTSDATPGQTMFTGATGTSVTTIAGANSANVVAIGLTGSAAGCAIMSYNGTSWIQSGFVNSGLSVNAVAISSSGSMVVTSTSSTVNVYKNVSSSWGLNNYISLANATSISCSFDENVIAIGVPGAATTSSGSVQLFETTSWKKIKTLSNSSSVNFGQSVSLSSNGSSIAIGSASSQGSVAGAGYVYMTNLMVLDNGTLSSEYLAVSEGATFSGTVTAGSLGVTGAVSINGSFTTSPIYYPQSATATSICGITSGTPSVVFIQGATSATQGITMMGAFSDGQNFTIRKLGTVASILNIFGGVGGTTFYPAAVTGTTPYVLPTTTFGANLIYSSLGNSVGAGATGGRWVVTNTF
jgi:hypothetical protein